MHSTLTLRRQTLRCNMSTSAHLANLVHMQCDITWAAMCAKQAAAELTFGALEAVEVAVA